MGKLTDPRVLRSRASIEPAFLQLLESKSCEKISVKEILDLSGYSRSAFYANYGTKQGLIDSILDHLSAEISIVVQCTFRDEQHSMLRAKVLYLFEYIYEHRVVFNKLIFLNHDYKDYCQCKTIGMLPDGKAEKNKSEVIDYLTLQYNMFIGAVFSAVEWWKQSGYKFSPQYVGDMFIDIMYQNNQNR